MGKPNRKDVVVPDRPGTLMAGSAQLPAYLQGFQGASGSEDITTDDVSIPRLKLAQGLSGEVKEGAASIGDMVLNINGEVLNEDGEKLPFVVLGYAKEYILWRPKMDNGGGILARAKPVKTEDGIRYKWDQPNASFNVKVGGILEVTWRTKEYIDEDGLNEWGSEIPSDPKSKKAATEHHNYVIALPTHNNLICALSLSKTQTPIAKNFNSTLKMGSAPRASRIFTVEAVDDNRGGHDFKSHKFRAAGFVSDEAQFNAYRELEAGFKKKGINVDQRDDDTPEERDERA